MHESNDDSGFFPRDQQGCIKETVETAYQWINRDFSHLSINSLKTKSESAIRFTVPCNHAAMHPCYLKLPQQIFQR
jgi:hypothetical protein